MILNFDAKESTGDFERKMEILVRCELNAVLTVEAQNQFQCQSVALAVLNSLIQKQLAT
jgi:hypothetical protein